jgi:hypothetical protein
MPRDLSCYEDVLATAATEDLAFEPGRRPRSTLLGRCCLGSIMIAPPRCALALTTDTSVLIAIGNDYGYERLAAVTGQKKLTDVC